MRKVSKLKKTAQTTPGVVIKVLVSFFFHLVLSFCCHADVKKNFLFEESRVIKFIVYSIEKRFDLPLRFRL